MHAGDFRLFCGDLGNEVTDEMLGSAFRKYKSFAKAKVGRALALPQQACGPGGPGGAWVWLAERVFLSTRGQLLPLY